MAKFGEYEKNYPETMDLVNTSGKRGSRFYSTFTNNVLQYKDILRHSHVVRQ